MKRILKYFPLIILLIIIMSYCSCKDAGKEIIGEWENVSVENPSSFFKNVVLTYKKGDIDLTFYHDGRFNWINKKDKSNITGKFWFSWNNLYLDNEKEPPALKTLYILKDNNLIIITEDKFNFTFQRKIGK